MHVRQIVKKLPRVRDLLFCVLAAYAVVFQFAGIFQLCSGSQNGILTGDIPRKYFIVLGVLILSLTVLIYGLIFKGGGYSKPFLDGDTLLDSFYCSYV